MCPGSSTLARSLPWKRGSAAWLRWLGERWLPYIQTLLPLPVLPTNTAKLENKRAPLAES